MANASAYRADAAVRTERADVGPPNGDYDLISATNGSTIPGLRIEFLTIDVNGDGVIDWDEGFMRVWVPARTTDTVANYATGRRWYPQGSALNTLNDPNMTSQNWRREHEGLQYRRS